MLTQFYRTQLTSKISKKFDNKPRWKLCAVKVYFRLCSTLRNTSATAVPIDIFGHNKQIKCLQNDTADNFKNFKFTMITFYNIFLPHTWSRTRPDSAMASTLGNSPGQFSGMQKNWQGFCRPIGQGYLALICSSTAQEIPIKRSSSSPFSKK